MPPQVWMVPSSSSAAEPPVPAATWVAAEARIGVSSCMLELSPQPTIAPSERRPIACESPKSIEIAVRLSKTVNGRSPQVVRRDCA